jgi:hypothetical protein
MTLKRLVMALAAIALISLSAASAKADDITTYSLSNVTFAGGGTATGSFSYDFTSGDFTAINIAVDGAQGTPDQTFTLSNFVPNDFENQTGFCTACDPVAYNFDQFTLNDGTDVLFLDLLFPPATSENGTLDPLIPSFGPISGYESSLYYDCSNSTSDPGCDLYDNIQTGALYAGTLTATPEPSTLLLLGIGLAGMLFAYSRRRNAGSLAVSQA